MLHQCPTSNSRLGLSLTLILIFIFTNNVVVAPAHVINSFASTTKKLLTKDPTPIKYGAADKKRLDDSATTTLPAPEHSMPSRISEAYGKLPLSFEANQGQTNSQVKFISRGEGYSLFLAATEAVFSLSRPSRRKTQSRSLASRKAMVDTDRMTQTSVVRMKLVGANPASQVEGSDELPGKSNYLIGNDPEKWRTNIPNYARVRYKELYPGVDAVYYGDQRQLEYDFVVAPGANPSSIRLFFEGVRKVRIDASGDLVLGTATGEVRQHKPVVYQEDGGARRYVAGRYRLKGKHEIGFEITKYDTSKPLVIDPILVYSSYLGGGFAEFGHGIAVDDFGNVYIAGETSSTDFPTKTPFQSQLGGNVLGVTDAFVTKVNAAGSAVIYSTYLGGSNYDRAYAIAVDRSGSAVITGETFSTDFPTKDPAQSQFVGGTDAFIARLNPEGSALAFSTYLGGTGFDTGYGISVDSSGNVYVTGSAGPGWPTTVQAFQPNFNCCHDEAFITKLNPNGTQLLYSTYLGGRDAEVGLAIAVDASQNAYITGSTASAFDFPTRNALQSTFGGGVSDAFVAKISTITAPFPFPLETFDLENNGTPASPYTNFSNWNVTSGRVNLAQDTFTSKGLTVNFDGYPPQSPAQSPWSRLAQLSGSTCRESLSP